MVLKIPHLIITPGEPAGIGPDITIQIAQQTWDAVITVIADPDMLKARAAQLELPLTINTFDINAPLKAHQPGTLSVLPVTLNTKAAAGTLDRSNAAYVVKTLEIAADICKQKKANAIVTGPVHKSILNEAGIAFSGHTEFFAEYAQVKQTVMLFFVDKLKVALATTHIPLAKVSSALTESHLQNIITILHHDLKHYFGIESPRIGICGLNPHAGEEGHLGLEEIEVMQPVIEKLRAEGFNLSDPLPADTMFIPAKLQKFDGFDRAVNMTRGLPIIRTSVDHGTALDMAGSGKANAGSMEAAIELAIKLILRT
jgi:4-hydroxythreonine-4-phosphate dehydrogenase